MPRNAEDAIRLAILNHPQTFGLTEAEVNPMLLYVQHRMEHGEGEQVEMWKLCFDVVSTTLHGKVVEVFTSLSVLQSPAQEAAIAAASASGGPEPKATLEVPRLSESISKPASNGASQSSPGRELSIKQLRYLGYLHRQLREEPDYAVISKLSQKEATMRIKDLEARVKG